MTRERIGEFELIRRLAERLGQPPPEGVIGIGDDAAGIPTPEGWLLLTCDIAVEGRHFRLEEASLADLGWKAATANVSDIAACGGRPRFALISLGVPAHLEPARLDALYAGIAEAGAAYGFFVVGGNVSGSAELIVDIFMTGHTNRFVPRGGARPGHLLAVSGALGDAAAALELTGGRAAGPVEQALVRRHWRPRARTDLAEALCAGASAAIDISDGLSSELHHIAEASAVRLEIERARIPCSPELAAFARARGADPLRWALHGGESYELLFSFPREEESRFAALGATVIGEAREGRGVFCSGEPLAPEGWDHLRK
jgi:thiamine-monophosphate kinase